MTKTKKYRELHRPGRFKKKYCGKTVLKNDTQKQKMTQQNKKQIKQKNMTKNKKITKHKERTDKIQN